MIKGFLYKDLVIFRWDIAAIVITLLFCIFVSIVGVVTGVANEAFTMLVIALGLMLMMITKMLFPDIIKYDERHSIHNFSVSAPCSKRGFVLSKYIVLFLVYVFVLALIIVTSLLLSFISGSFTADFVKPLIAIFAWYIAITAIQLPLIFFFSSKYYSAVLGLSFSITFLAVFVYALFGDISFFLKEDFMGRIMKFLQSDVMSYISYIALGIAIVLYVISYFISLPAFSKGIENFEE